MSSRAYEIAAASRARTPAAPSPREQMLIDETWAELEQTLLSQARMIIRTRLAHERANMAPGMAPVFDSMELKVALHALRVTPEG